MKMFTASALFCAMLVLAGVADGQIDLPIEPEPYADLGDSVPEEEEDSMEDSLCPEGWTPASFGCVLFVPFERTWAESEEFCQVMFGNLSSLLGDEYFDSILLAIDSAGIETKQVWVGGFNSTEDSSWTSSQESKFEGWCSGEAAQPEHHCAKLVFGDKVCLDYMPCDAKLPSVCTMMDT
ncbi:type-2 ice-structuring protein-like [Anoplopoma fimbria]|uniref:type-2 ice-structuring protein-like n=1 Tax=Anoplopoma fimbria TaxID=229290 RepID=UPI0023EB330D|nr:type-2 ice-structuring protein-like [Anoplopoma fimbria]